MSTPPIQQAMTPVNGDIIYPVEGALGNTKPLPADVVREGKTFYYLFAADASKKPEEVLALINDKYQSEIQTFVTTDPRQKNPLKQEKHDIYVDITRKAYRVQDEAVKNILQFRPDLTHLQFRFGKEAAYFMVPLKTRFTDDEKKDFFDEKERTTKSDHFINSKKFDFIFKTKPADVLLKSAQNLSQHPQPLEPFVYIAHGGFGIYDRIKPNGKGAASFKIAQLNDSHVAKLNDDLERRILDLPDRLKPYKNLLDASARADNLEAGLNQTDIYLKFNNPNTNWFAVVKALNASYLAGEIAHVIVLGDSWDHDGVNHEPSKSLATSNARIFIEGLSNLLCPVTVVLGNHEKLAVEAPAAIHAGTYQLTGKQTAILQPELQGFKTFKAAIDAINNDDSAGRSYYAYINPFNDMIFTFEGRELSPEILAAQEKIDTQLGDQTKRSPREIKPVTLLLMDTGPDDLMHVREDDPIYDEQEQGVRIWQSPQIHPITTWQTITQSSPDTVGLVKEQLAWLASQKFNYLFTHAPLLNGEKSKSYDRDPQAKIIPLTDAGPYRDNNIGSHSHNGEILLPILINKPEFYGSVGAHTHSTGNEYIAGVDNSGQIKLFTGSLLHTIQAIHDNPQYTTTAQKEKAINDLWNASDTSLHNGSSQEVKNLFGITDATTVNLHRPKFFWQIGAAGTGGNPTFAIMDINANGQIANIEMKYVKKELVLEKRKTSSENEPVCSRENHTYTLKTSVTDKPAGRNERLVTQWEQIKEKAPCAALDWAKAKRELEQRRHFKVGKAYHWDAARIYPPVPAAEVVDPIISDSKLYRHINFRFYGAYNQMPGEETRIGQWGISAGYLFSRFSDMGPIWRSLIWEGVQLGFEGDGYGKVDKLRFHISGHFPDFIDSQIGHFYLRAFSFGVGAEVEKYLHSKKDADVSSFFDLKLLEASLRFGLWEVGLGAHWEWNGVLRNNRIFGDLMTGFRF